MKIIIKINGLQYNALRDPQVYRRCVKAPFRIQAVVAGTGTARCTLSDVAGEKLVERAINLPGTFTHDLAFDAPGTRIVTLNVGAGADKSSQDLRLDVLEQAWVG